MKAIYLRVDVDGYYGFRRGIKNLVSVLDKYGYKATFFINVGKEASVINILRYRKSKDKVSRGVARRYSFFQKLRMALFPRKIPSKKITSMLKEERFEIQLHAFHHLLWTKAFATLNKEKEIDRMIKEFKKYVGENPIGFAPPGFKINDRVYKLLKDKGFVYVSSKFGKNPYLNNFGLIEFPITFKYNLEELLIKGYNESKSVNAILKHIKNKRGYISIYCHADFEGLRGLHLFEELMMRINKLNIPVRNYSFLLKKLKKPK